MVCHIFRPPSWPVISLKSSACLRAKQLQLVGSVKSSEQIFSRICQATKCQSWRNCPTEFHWRPVPDFLLFPLDVLAEIHRRLEQLCCCVKSHCKSHWARQEVSESLLSKKAANWNNPVTPPSCFSVLFYASTVWVWQCGGVNLQWVFCRRNISTRVLDWQFIILRVCKTKLQSKYRKEKLQTLQAAFAAVQFKLSLWLCTETLTPSAQLQRNYYIVW